MQKEAYLMEMDSMLEAMTAEIEELESKRNRLVGIVPTLAQERIEELFLLRDEVRGELDGIARETGEGWEGSREEVRRSFDRLRNAIDDANVELRRSA